MSAPVAVAAPAPGLEIFGVRLLGADAQNGRKLLLTIALFVVLYVLAKVLGRVTRAVRGHAQRRVAFWTGQGISLVMFILGIIGFVSIWFDNPARLATGVGLLGAGLAFALQKVVTSFAGYFVILRGKTFNHGDRITMGGVRGDVIALSFLQTSIMEMGEPPSMQDADPSVWVRSRQYTGRIVTVSNAQIFEEPVYNYTREFPYIWEELALPISFRDDRALVEQILLEAASKETIAISELAIPALETLERRFAMKRSEIAPRVYLRITDNWIELTVRFLCKDHDIRGLKDRMSREIMGKLDAANIGIASSTYDIVGMPPLRVRLEAGGDALTSQQAP
ncbi:mechanosensitive ion channel [soil metagenome]